MEFSEQVKSSVDIVKVVGEYVRLKRVGSTGRYLGLCPFHQEKTPSFNVNQSRQFYKCFGCGAGGDVFKFVMEIEGLTFPEVLKDLAESTGIPMPKRSEFSSAESRLRAALYDLHALAADLFRDNLRAPQGAAARAYLESRGVSPEMIATFGLGYSEPSPQSLARRLSEKGFTREQMDASGIVRDLFGNRLIFPIHDERGKVIAFGARALHKEQMAKYVNSPETPIYRKSSVLYNLHRAKDAMSKQNRVVLVEGYMDVIGAYTAGVTGVVASCGTALTPQQVDAMSRRAETAVINFDPDSAGANAAEKAIQLLLDRGMHVRVLTLEGGLDPDEYVKEYGAETYCRKIESAGGYFHWLADRARARYPKTAEGRVDAFKFLLPVVQNIHDKIERASVANDLAAYLGVEQSLVLEQLKRASLGKPAADRRAAPQQPPAQQSNVSPMERVLLTALLASDEARAEVLPQLTPAMTHGFYTREIFDALRQVNGLAGPAAFSAAEGRLNPPAQALLHELVAADDMNDGESGLEQARACLRKLEAGMWKRRLDELKARVKAAEREGRMEEALQLMSELHQLEQESKLEF